MDAALEKMASDVLNAAFAPTPAELDWAAGLVSNNQPDDWEKLALFLIASIDFRYLD